MQDVKDFKCLHEIRIINPNGNRVAICNMLSTYRRGCADIGLNIKLRNAVIERSNNLNGMRNVLELTITGRISCSVTVFYLFLVFCEL